MNDPVKSKTEFTDVCHCAVQCRDCFKDAQLNLGEAENVKIAQPRWVGSKYWNSKPRIVIVMLNPGSGDGRRKLQDPNVQKTLDEFRECKDERKLDEALNYQREDMQHWGRGNGQFLDFYSKMGLETDIANKTIAFANIAWCGTSGNEYPDKMLDNCYKKHTKVLLKILDPDLVILSGRGLERFGSKIKDLIPKCEIVQTLHFANRKSNNEKAAAQNRVKAEVQRVKQKLLID